MEDLKKRIQNDTVAAMRAKDKPRLGTLRLLAAAIKQREIDDQTSLDDNGVIKVIEKMIKQRRDSIEQYEAGNRPELAEREKQEIDVLQAYMPAALSEAEIDKLIDEAIQSTGAASMKEMGKVMGTLKPKLQGRADMGAVSAKIRKRLGGH